MSTPARKSLTPTQRAALRSVAWACQHFAGATSSRVMRLRTLRALEKLGLVTDAGLLVLCDGDGYALEPERYRQGWKITAAGRHELAGEGKEPPP